MKQNPVSVWENILNNFTGDYRASCWLWNNAMQRTNANKLMWNGTELQGINL